MSDDQARHIGKITLGVFLAGPALGLLGLLLASEAPALFETPWFVVTCAGMSVAAYTVAAVAARKHKGAAPYLDASDLKGWEWRMGTKAAPIMPFIYLLSTAEERRVGNPRDVKGV